MANRNIQQKMLKNKRRGRFARFSGATAKYAVRTGPTPFEEDAQGKTKSKSTVMVLVGEVSLSRQVMSTGRGPNAERMAEYYARLRSLQDEVLPQSKLMARYNKVVEEEKMMRITLVHNPRGRLDLFFYSNRNVWFFVDVDNINETMKRSREYGSKQKALDALRHKRICWVEHCSP